MQGSLYLSPEDPYASAEPASLLQVLEQFRIAADPLPGSGSARLFRAGDGFARHVIFAGCSPHLRFEPRDSDDLAFCHVALHGVFDQPSIVTGENSVIPRCPHCRKRLNDWRERLQAPAPLACPGCARELDPALLDWRQHAAVGRVLLELRNVFPGEAAPSDQLTCALVDATGIAWRHAWAAMLRR